MASLNYDAVDFATTLGGLPRVSREITRELDQQSGQILREHHVISCEWHGIPAAGTLDQQQASITAIEAAIEALADDGILYFAENDGGIAWCYDDATKANNHVTIYGVKITRKSFPWGPAKHVTNAPLQLTFEATVIPCSNDPVTGVGTLVYQVSEEWDTSGLVSVTYTGRVCACSGYDVDDVVLTLRDTVFTPDARDRFTAAGSLPGGGFGPTAQGYTALDTGSHCKDFRFVYGGGASPTGLEATHLELSVNVSIKDNLVTLEAAASYGYRGDYIGTGLSTGSMFGASVGGGMLVFTPTSGLLIGAATGSSAFDAVYKEAWNFAGVDVRPFLPPGAGAIFLVTDPQVSVDTANNRIVSRKTFYANWIWDASILLYDMQVSVDMSQPGFGSRRLMHASPGTPVPLPYCNTSGRNVMIVTFLATIVSKHAYLTLPDQLTADPLNVWRIEPDNVTGYSKLPNQTQLPSTMQEGYTTSVVKQTWAVRNPLMLPQGFVVGSVRRLKTVSASMPLPIAWLL